MKLLLKKSIKNHAARFCISSITGVFEQNIAIFGANTAKKAARRLKIFGALN